MDLKLSSKHILTTNIPDTTFCFQVRKWNTQHPHPRASPDRMEAQAQKSIIVHLRFEKGDGSQGKGPVIGRVSLRVFV